MSFDYIVLFFSRYALIIAVFWCFILRGCQSSPFCFKIAGKRPVAAAFSAVAEQYARRRLKHAGPVFGKLLAPLTATLKPAHLIGGKILAEHRKIKTVFAFVKPAYLGKGSLSEVGEEIVGIKPQRAGSRRFAVSVVNEKQTYDGLLGGSRTRVLCRIRIHPVAEISYGSHRRPAQLRAVLLFTPSALALHIALYDVSRKRQPLRGAEYVDLALDIGIIIGDYPYQLFGGA